MNIKYKQIVANLKNKNQPEQKHNMCRKNKASLFYLKREKKKQISIDR